MTLGHSKIFDHWRFPWQPNLSPFRIVLSELFAKGTCAQRVVNGNKSSQIITPHWKNSNLWTSEWFTPPKTNMEPENGPLEKEIPIGNHHFQVPAVNFWGCMFCYILWAPPPLTISCFDLIHSWCEHFASPADRRLLVVTRLRTISGTSRAAAYPAWSISSLIETWRKSARSKYSTRKKLSEYDQDGHPIVMNIW